MSRRGMLPFYCPFGALGFRWRWRKGNRRIQQADFSRQMFGRQVRVPHHHPQPAKQFGHGAKGGALHDQPRRERVPQIMPGKVRHAGELKRRVKRVLDVSHRLAALTASRVREDVRAIRHAFVEQRLQGRDHRRIERQRVRAATLRPWNAEDAVEKVHVIPSQVKQAPAPQSSVRGEDDFLGQERRRIDRLRGLQQLRVLVCGEISKARVVFVEKLDAPDGVRRGEIARDTPVEEGFQDRQILIDRAVSDILRASELDVIDVTGRDRREQRVRIQVCFPHGEHGLDVR